jgi:hypothetical protein
MPWYDENVESDYLLYIDANTLYGKSMSQPLPYADLQFEMLTLEEILAIPDDADKGCFVECDFEFPKHLHKKLKQFPPCQENLIPKKEWLSKFQNELIEENNIESNCSNLIPHLYEHEN